MGVIGKAHRPEIGCTAIAPSKERVFFSEEKNQKTFTSGASGTIPAGPATLGGGEVKVFCFFFSKKKAFA